MDDLRRDEDNAQRNRRFDWGPGTCTQPSVAPASQTVRGGERRDGDEQSSRSLHQEHQSEHEQQVIEPGQDVFDPKIV